MFTVNWQHILMDPTVYQAAGTHRVAKLRDRNPTLSFPVAATNTWLGSFWQPDRRPRASEPNAEGWAPDTYVHDGKTFKFGFWSVVAKLGTRTLASNVATHPFPATSYVDGTVVQATAWYVWDFAGGGGDHGAYIDAFDITAGVFLRDDFVDVEVDGDSSSARTTAANDGFLLSAEIKKAVITAKPRLDGGLIFRRWEPLADSIVDFMPGEPGLTVVDQTITLHTNDIIVAIALYEQVSEPPPPPFRKPDEPYREFTFIIGNLADGWYVRFTPYGPQPVGPWTSAPIKQISEVLQQILKHLENLN